MKGLVFTEFLNHVEQGFGPDMVDDIIEASDLASGGSYTSVGTYDYAEMHALVANLAAASGQPVAALLEGFGHYCFGRWTCYAPQFFANAANLFDMLEGVHDYHQTEVRKLYPDAELPSFATEARSPQQLVMSYRSCRPLSQLAVGVIKGAADHYGERVLVATEPATDDAGAYVRISITRA